MYCREVFADICYEGLILLPASHSISVPCLIQLLTGIRIPHTFLLSSTYTMSADLIIHCIQLMLVIRLAKF